MMCENSFGTNRSVKISKLGGNPFEQNEICKIPSFVNRNDPINLNEKKYSYLNEIFIGHAITTNNIFIIESIHIFLEILHAFKHFKKFIYDEKNCLVHI